ncbi:transposase [Saccharopolyspora sp. ASAGF58]|nr:transposase [Saccharopolyspora sp. ASAGF58]
MRTARAGEDFSSVRRVGMDETSARRGRTTSACSPISTPPGCPPFATEGRDAATVERFAADLAAHGGDPKKVHTTSSDMSAAFIAGIGETPRAADLRPVSPGGQAVRGR